MFQNKATILCLIAFLFIAPDTFSQDSESKVSLLKTLKQIEKSFDVKFSYIRRDLKNIEVVPLPEQSTLQQVLSTLTSEANLTFTQIKDRYITVQIREASKVSVCGILIETESSTPIENAEIVTDEIVVVSDSGGNFRLENIENDKFLSIVVNGFVVRKISVRELSSTNTCPFLYISQFYTYLPEVVLKNYITKGISKNTEGATTIQNENFDILPSLIEPDVLQIAQALPGIESADETAANLNVRGGTSDEFLILWNDIRMYQTGHFFGLISAFNPNLTHSVEIYKNGTNAKYGEGVSGVIAMQPNTTIPEDIDGAIGVNLTSVNGYIEIPASERFLISVSGRSSINTGIGNPVYNQFFSRIFQNTVVTNLQDNSTEEVRSTDQEFNFFDVSAKAIWKFTNRDQLVYDFLTIDNKLEFSELFVAEDSGARFESELEKQNTSNSFAWERNWGNKNLLVSKAMFYFSNYNRNEFTNDVDLELLSSNQNKVNEQGVKANLTYSPSKDVKLTGGYQYTDTKISDAFTNSSSPSVDSVENSLISNAFYISNTLLLFNKKTSITGGLRFTSYPNIENSFLEPRLHIDQKIYSNFRVHLSGEFKHQGVYQKTNSRNTILGVETQDWLLADGLENPFLRSKQFGLGLSYTKSNWTISADGYVKEVEGIKSDNPGFRNQLQNTNLKGSYLAKGIELSINKRTENLNVWVSYAFLDNNYTFENFAPTTFRNLLDSNHSVTLAGSFDYKKFSFSLGNTLKSGLPYTRPVAGNEIITSNEGITVINFETPNSSTLPTYLRTDFSASYQTDLDDTFSGEVNIAFLNILNRKNALDRFYLLETDDSGVPTLRQVNEFSLGFTPNISLRLSF